MNRAKAQRHATQTTSPIRANKQPPATPTIIAAGAIFIC